MYKVLRDQMIESLKSEKEQENKKRMEELEKKIRLLELSESESESRAQKDREAQEQSRGTVTRAFSTTLRLIRLKTYDWSEFKIMLRTYFYKHYSRMP